MGVNPGFEQQNSTAAECGGAALGSDLAARAWLAKDERTPKVVVARYGPVSSAGGAVGLLSRQFARAI
jgi:hypothetical protein